MPVVAKLTSEVAASGAKAEDLGSGLHMKAGLFLDGIDVYRRGLGMDQIIEPSADIFLVSAEATLALLYNASSETDLALNYVIAEPLIEHRLAKDARIYLCRCPFRN